MTRQYSMILVIALVISMSCGSSKTVTLRTYEKERDRFFGGSPYREVIIPDSLKSNDTENLQYALDEVSSKSGKVHIKYGILIDRNGLLRDYSIQTDDGNSRPVELNEGAYWGKIMGCSIGNSGAALRRCIAGVNQQLIDDCSDAIESDDPDKIAEDCWFLDIQ